MRRIELMIIVLNGLLALQLESQFELTKAG